MFLKVLMENARLSVADTVKLLQPEKYLVLLPNRNGPHSITSYILFLYVL